MFDLHMFYALRNVKLEKFLILRCVKRNVIWAKISSYLDTQNALRCGKRRRLNVTLEVNC